MVSAVGGPRSPATVASNAVQTLQAERRYGFSQKKQWDVHCYVRLGFAVENGYLKCGLRLCVLVLTIIYVNLFRYHLYGWFGQLL